MIVESPEEQTYHDAIADASMDDVSWLKVYVSLYYKAWLENLVKADRLRIKYYKYRFYLLYEELLCRYRFELGPYGEIFFDRCKVPDAKEREELKEKGWPQGPFPNPVL